VFIKPIYFRHANPFWPKSRRSASPEATFIINVSYIAGKTNSCERSLSSMKNTFKRICIRKSAANVGSCLEASANSNV